MAHPTRKYGKRESNVRHLIETVAENILGNSFENVNITGLSDDVAYLQFLEKYEGVLSLTLSRLKSAIQLIIDGVSSIEDVAPNNIENQLKELINEIIREASITDAKKVFKSRRIPKGNITSKTYEDILAIAIINKIVENLSFKAGSISMASLPNSTENQDFNGNEGYLNETQLDTKIREMKEYASETRWNKQKLELPDLEVELPQVKHHGTRWEENWLFRQRDTEVSFTDISKHKKRKVVPMFVPSPNTYVSPLIGETSVDELSDLSDLSDSEIEQLVYE